jgi:hypothetical protein
MLWLCCCQSTATEIKLGLVTTIIPSAGSDPLAAYLAAVSTINADPVTYLGDASYTVVPYWMLPLSGADADTYKIGGMRSVMRMGSNNYTAIDGTTGFSAIKPLPENATNPNVDIILLGGGTLGSLSMAPVAEFLSKPCLGIIDNGDPLSNKVRNCKTRLSRSLALSLLRGTSSIPPPISLTHPPS